MKAVIMTPALVAAMLIVGSADARGSYCSRHPSLCEQRHREEAQAAAAAQATYDRWYAALSPIDRAREDTRVEIRSRLIPVANRINDASMQVRNIGQQAQDDVDDARRKSIIYLLVSAILFGALGFLAGRPDL